MSAAGKLERAPALHQRTVVGAVFLGFVVTTGLTLWNAYALITAFGAVTRTHDEIVALKEVFSLVQDAETGQRGFLLTGDEAYLTPYHRAQAALGSKTQHLSLLLSADAAQQERFQRLQRQIEAKLAELNQSVEIRKRQGFERAQALVLNHRGKTEMDALRNTVGELVQQATQRRVERLQKMRSTATLGFISALLSGCLGLAITQIVRRLLRRNRAVTEALHEERERLNTTLLSIGDGVIVTDARGAVRMMNTVAQELTGWDAHSSQGVPLDQVFHIVNEDSRKAVDNPALRALREGKIFGLANHTVLIARDGTERPIDDSAAPIRSREGTLLGAVLVFRDVSERHHSEQVLRHSEQRLRRVIDSMFAFVGVMDPDGTLLEANSAPLVVAGLQREEVIGKKFWDCPWWNYDEAVQGRLHEAYTRALRGETVRYDTPIRIANDGRMVIDFMLQPVMEAGQVVFLIPSGVDITARTQTEQKLAESERRLSAVLNNATVAIFLLDNRQHCVYMNEAAEKLTGYRLADTQGRPLHEVVHHTHPDGRPYPLTECPIDQAFPTRNQMQGDEVFVHRDGHFYPVAFTASPVRDESGEPVGTILEVRDIRAEKAAAEALLRSRQALQEADQRKNEFLATLAHELRNPLAPIRNGLELLRQARGGERMEAVREMMSRQLTHMVNLIDDLLDISRITTDKVVLRQQRVALQEVAQAAVEASLPAIEEAHHTLTRDYAPESVWVQGDPTRLAQVIGNLLTNAAKYTPHGGAIHLSVAQDGAQALVRVSDNGVGIPPAMLGDIFTMFTQINRTLERAQGGLGIGLALAKRLVEMHGGLIHAYSDGPGQGATFEVRLPLLNDAASLPGRDTPTPVQSTAHPALRHILIVDDNVDSAFTFAMLLEMEGYITRTAHKAEEVLSEARAFQPEVIFLDIGLPGMNGYEIARQLRADPALHQIVLVACTGWGSPQDVKKALDAGFDLHLTKPVQYRDLLEAMDKAARLAQERE